MFGQRRTTASGTAAALLSLVLVCAGCDDETPQDAQVPASQETTGADCARIIPDEAVTVLGWSDDTGATYSSLGCERRASQGYLKVRALTVPRAADDDTAVQQEFDARCAVLDSSPDPAITTEDPATGMLVTWLGPDVTACAVEPDLDIGLSKVLLVTSSGGLAELWVAALETTDQELVRQSLTLLADAAMAQL